MDKTELVLGRGEVYFDRFLPGTRTGEGERYIGNTPAVAVERRAEFATAERSVNGVRARNMKELMRESVIVTFTTDNMSADNMADWLGGTAEDTVVPRSAAEMETFTIVPGRFYQLGLTKFPMVGARNLWALGVRVGETFIRDLYVDMENGRVGIPANRTDLIGQTAICEYEIRRSKSKTISGAAKAIRGALRFIGRNAFGDNANYYFPHVVLNPRDQLNLKGDNWQSVSFEAESLAKMVIYSSGKAGRSPGELALIEEGLSTDGFVVVEGVLNQSVNGY